MSLVQQLLIQGMMLLTYLYFNKTSHPFLVLPAISSLSASYELVASPYLTPVVKFMACSFGHITSACSTPMFYRCTWQSILTRSSTAQRTLTFSICTTFSATYFHSLVVTNVPTPHTVSHQNDAAASHSYHFNTELY